MSTNESKEDPGPNEPPSADDSLDDLWGFDDDLEALDDIAIDVEIDTTWEKPMTDGRLITMPGFRPAIADVRDSNPDDDPLPGYFGAHDWITRAVLLEAHGRDELRWIAAYPATSTIETHGPMLSVGEVLAQQRGEEDRRVVLRIGEGLVVGVYLPRGRSLIVELSLAERSAGRALLELWTLTKDIETIMGPSD